jgi:hypothetical protein
MKRGTIMEKWLKKARGSKGADEDQENDIAIIADSRLYGVAWGLFS